MRTLKSDIKLKSFSCSEFDYVCGEMQGWRPNMQDSYICGYQNIKKGLSLFAVFDGHGGGHVSNFLAQQFISVFKLTPQFEKQDYVRALQKSFQILDRKLITQQGISKLNQLKKDKNRLNQKQLQIPPAMLTGSTANVVLLTNQKIIVANCGDSRSALYIGDSKQTISNKYIQLSQDHKPDSHQQKIRIQKAGGYVVNGRTNANLSLSRAFGDFYYKLNQSFNYKQQVITCHPQITVFNRPKITKNNRNQQLTFMIIGCDGIWQRFQENSAGLLQIVRCDLVLGQSLQKSMKNLLNLLVSKQPKDIIENKGKGCDNMSAIIVKFK